MEIQRRMDPERIRKQDKAVVDDYLNSELTVLEICEKHDIAVGTLYRALEREEERLGNKLEGRKEDGFKQ